MNNLLLFFDISSGELLIILLVAFLVFGPNRIPEIARKIGRGMNEIRRASDEIKREIKKETNKLEKELQIEKTKLDDLKDTSKEIRDKLNKLDEDIQPGTEPKKKVDSDPGKTK